MNSISKTNWEGPTWRFPAAEGLRPLGSLLRKNGTRNEHRVPKSRTTASRLCFRKTAKFDGFDFPW